MFQCSTGLEITSNSKVNMYNNKEHQGDFSISGIVIMDIISKSNKKFKAKTILDTGAGTNFISKEILPLIKYESIKTEGLKIAGINSTQEKIHELVKIYLDKDSCPIKYLKCYVLPDLIEYKLKEDKIKEMIQDCKDMPGFINPLEKKIDHREGISIVIGPGAIRDISYAPPIWYGKYTIDRTYFGPAINGRINSNSLNQVSNFNEIRQITNSRYINFK